MIKNRKQLQVAKSKIRGLEETRDELDPSEKSAWRAYSDLIEDAFASVTEYEDIQEGRITSFEIKSLDDVGEALIKARIARGWTQSDCAKQIGVSEQQVQKDEARDFEHAGLARCAELLDVLGYELVGRVQPKGVRRYAGDDGDSKSTELRPDISWTGSHEVFRTPTSGWNGSADALRKWVALLGSSRNTEAPHED